MSCQRIFVQAEKAKHKEELEKEARMRKAKAAAAKKQEAEAQGGGLTPPGQKEGGLTPGAHKAKAKADAKKVAAPPLANLDKDNADYYKNVQEDIATILRVFGQDFGSKPAAQIAPQSREGEGGVQEALFVFSFIFPLQRNK